jgi:hypothetical protein
MLKGGMMDNEKILSSRLVASDNKEIVEDNLEVTTEKVITETRTYEKAFLERQWEQITQDKIDYAIARDKELTEIEGLLKLFEGVK